MQTLMLKCTAAASQIPELTITQNPYIITELADSWLRIMCICHLVIMIYGHSLQWVSSKHTSHQPFDKRVQLTFKMYNYGVAKKMSLTMMRSSRG